MLDLESYEARPDRVREAQRHRAQSRRDFIEAVENAPFDFQYRVVENMGEGEELNWQPWWEKPLDNREDAMDRLKHRRRTYAPYGRTFKLQRRRIERTWKDVS